MPGRPISRARKQWQAEMQAKIDAGEISADDVWLSIRDRKKELIEASKAQEQIMRENQEAIEEKKRRGRPPVWTDKESVQREICKRLTMGLSLNQICRDADMPDQSTVQDWLGERVSFAKAYALARVSQADALFDQCLAIADEADGDIKIVKDKEGNEVPIVVQENIQRSKLRIETRFRLIGKLNPKKYGDKLMLAGHDGGAVQVEAVALDPRTISHEARDAIKQALLAAVKQGGEDVSEYE